MKTICYEPTTTILVADHDDENRGLIRAVLALKGFDVLEAINGEEAFKLAIVRQPALAVIDLKLPVENGFRVIRKLREAGFPPIPIIGTSQSEDVSHHALAIAAGCVAHLEKPVEPDQLDDLVDQLLPGESAHLMSVMVH